MGYTANGYYPPTGFHFVVYFEGISLNIYDVKFQEVSTISAEVQVAQQVSGGDSRVFHKPTGRSYPPLVLKRGLLSYTGLRNWFTDALDHYDINPATVTVALLNGNHLPVQAWVFKDAWPIKWEVSGLNAENGQIVAESITLVYSSYSVFEGLAF